MKIVFESGMPQDAVEAFMQGYNNPDSLPPVTFLTRADLERMQQSIPETEKE